MAVTIGAVLVGSHSDTNEDQGGDHPSMSTGHNWSTGARDAEVRATQAATVV